MCTIYNEHLFDFYCWGEHMKIIKKWVCRLLTKGVKYNIIELKGGMYMYDVLDVSRFVINYSNEKGYGVSNLKLQKILYFIQAFFLLNKNEPCFDEDIEAWDFGPVVPKVYREYKRYGSCDIPTIKSYYDSSDFWNSERIKYRDDIINKYDKELIMDVIDEFSDYSATALVQLTHKQKPWRDAYKPYENRVITNESIRSYFCE